MANSSSGIARLPAVSSHVGDWLRALQISSCCLRPETRFDDLQCVCDTMGDQHLRIIKQLGYVTRQYDQ